MVADRYLKRRGISAGGYLFEPLLDICDALGGDKIVKNIAINSEILEYVGNTLLLQLFLPATVVILQDGFKETSS